MQFVNPNFLYALFFLAIPIIIHLFNFRRYKKAYFTNVRFLKEIKEKSQSTSQLKNLLLLLIRLLALALLVLAFAQPYIPLGNNKNNISTNVVAIYIDNSFSMNNENSEGILLEQAKALSHEIVKSYPNTAQFYLLTNHFEGKYDRLLEKEVMLEEIDKVNYYSFPRKLKEIQNKCSQMIKWSGNEKPIIYLVSDFQEVNFDKKEASLQDSLFEYRAVYIETPTHDNVSIDSCWFADPYRGINKLERLHVRLKNFSNTERENIVLKLEVNQEQKSILNVTLAANQIMDTAVYFTVYNTGNIAGKLSIQDYPVTFDDALFFSYTIKSEIKILSLYQDEPLQDFKRLYQDEKNIVFSQNKLSGLDYSLLNKQQVVILENIHEVSTGLASELKKFVDQGGSLVLLPAKEVNPSVNEFFNILRIDQLLNLDTGKQRISFINVQSELYRDVFTEIPKNVILGELNQYYQTSQATQINREELLRIENGRSILNQYTSEKGKVYLFTFPFLENKFTRTPIFVPTCLKIAYQSVGNDFLYYSIGKDEMVKLNVQPSVSSETPFHLVSKAMQFDVIPEIRRNELHTQLFLRDQIKQAGPYEIQEEDSVLAILSFNDARQESDLKQKSKEELQTIFGPSFQIINSTETRASNIQSTIAQKNYWWYCILFASLLFILEVLLLRFWKR